MNWITIMAILLAVLILAGIVVKVILRRRLNDIDGLGGIHKESDGNIIASLGDEPPARRNKRHKR